MAISVNEIATGRKTFLITPDLSLIPESFLEDYFSLGFECYNINYDRKCTIQKKVDIICSVFHDVILFFNIDYQISGLDWETVIKDVIKKYNNRASIGILYAKRQSRDARADIENKYLFELGVSCGCIQLEYQKKQNFDIIVKMLYANQAQGRRKNIRAICTKACTFSVQYQEEHLNGVLQDISLSHFSFISSDTRFDSEVGTRISDFHFNVRGFLFRSNAVLIMKRPLNNEMLYIFAFTTQTGTPGLDARIKALLIPNIYQLLNSNCMSILEDMFANSNTDESYVERKLSGNIL